MGRNGRRAARLAAITMMLLGSLVAAVDVVGRFRAREAPISVARPVPSPDLS